MSELAKVGVSELAKVGVSELAKVGASELAKVGASEPEKTGARGFAKMVSRKKRPTRLLAHRPCFANEAFAGFWVRLPANLSSFQLRWSSALLLAFGSQRSPSVCLVPASRFSLQPLVSQLSAANLAASYLW